MRKKDEFYRFEETPGSQPYGGSSEKSSCSAAKVFVGLLVIALAAALIAVVVYYNTGERKTKLDAETPGSSDEQVGGTTTTTVAPPVEKLYRRIDCIPEGKGQYVNVTQELCLKRNCIYDSGNHGNNAPTCYFSTEKTGYSATNCRDTMLGFKCDLHLKGQGPFGLDLEMMEFEVQMLGDNIVRFKVRQISIFFFCTKIQSRQLRCWRCSNDEVFGQSFDKSISFAPVDGQVDTLHVDRYWSYHHNPPG